MRCSIKCCGLPGAYLRSLVCSQQQDTERQKQPTLRVASVLRTLANPCNVCLAARVDGLQWPAACRFESVSANFEVREHVCSQATLRRESAYRRGTRISVAISRIDCAVSHPKTYHHDHDLAQSVRACLVNALLTPLFRIFVALRAPKKEGFYTRPRATAVASVPLPLPAGARSANVWHFFHYSFLVGPLLYLT